VEYIVTFVVMLVVALTIAGLMANVRLQTRVAGARERRTALLYGMSRDLAATRGTENMVRIAIRHVSEGFASRTSVLLPNSEGQVRESGEVDAGENTRWADPSIAQWVHDHARPAGLGADALPGAPALYLPLTGSRGSLGVLAVLPSNRRRVLLPEQRHLLEAFAGQLALALERAQLASAAESSRIAAETESVRNTLLASISHDLRTPLAVITGASAALVERQLELSTDARIDLARSIASRAREMSELVSNVLDLIRFESGGVPVRRDWESIDDLVGAALNKVEPRLARHMIEVDLPADLPLVWVDAALLTQAIVNVLENAGKHTPPGTRVRIRATRDDAQVCLVIEDDGPGLPPGDPESLFVKFQRGRDESDVPGAGLGLAVCRVIVEAHGGLVRARNREDGRGARFELSLPTQGPAS
jgi:two-component system sensor histidine kinase KdpD